MNSKNVDIKKHILQLVNKNKLSHALLFCGNSDICTQFARDIAKALVCKSTENKACNVCTSCKKADSNNHPDIKIVFAKKGHKSLHVDDIRDLHEECYIVPNESNCKVYIIENAQNMTEQASNALLKLLEEPPAFVKFILTASDIYHLLPTVTSRCSYFFISSDKSSYKTSKENEYAEALLFSLDTSFADFMLKSGMLVKEKERTVILNTIDIISDKLDETMNIKVGNNYSNKENITYSLALKFSYKSLAELQKILLGFKNKLLMNGNKNILLTKLCVDIEKIFT